MDEVGFGPTWGLELFLVRYRRKKNTRFWVCNPLGEWQGGQFMRTFHEIITIITIQLLTRKHIVTSRDFLSSSREPCSFRSSRFLCEGSPAKATGNQLWSNDQTCSTEGPQSHGDWCRAGYRMHPNSQSLGSRKVQTCGPATDGRYTSLQGVPKGIPLRAKRDQLC